MIFPVKPGGWAPNMVPRATEFAAIDELLATRGVDASPSGDAITGRLSVSQDPLHIGTTPQMSGTVIVSASGAAMGG